MMTGMGKRTGLRVESSHFLRNTAGITSVEFFWGMGMPVLVESTFLQLFLRSLGASYFLIGLLPVFLGLSIPVFSLFSAYLSSRLHRKRSSVILFHMAAAVPVALFGLFLLIVTPEEGVLQLFIAVYFLFSVGVGFTLPAWQNYLVSLFTHRDSLRALSVMYVVQSVSKVVGSIVVYQTVARFALSVQGASLVFTFAGCILFFGALLFLLTREEYDPDNAPPPFAGPLDFISRLRGILSSPRFRTFIAADFSYFAVIVVLSFYGNYAREFGGIPEELVAGAFVAVSYGGGILVQVVFGWLNVFSLRGKMVVSKLLGIAGAVLLIPAASPALFFLSAALLGGGRALRMLMYPPAVKALARSRDVTPHFAVIALVELPFSTGLPLLTGLFLDHFSYLQGDHYRLLFLFAALLLGVGLYFSARLDFTDHGEESDRTAGA
jgi:MFS family permease